MIFHMDVDQKKEQRNQNVRSETGSRVPIESLLM